MHIFKTLSCNFTSNCCNFAQDDILQQKVSILCCYDFVKFVIVPLNVAIIQQKHRFYNNCLNLVKFAI